MWSSVEERVALLELLATGRLRRRQSQEQAFAALRELPWTRESGRRDEVAVVESRRSDLIALIDRVWPQWRGALTELVARGHQPTPDGWVRLQDELRAKGIGDLPSFLNKHTAAALTAPHSKAPLIERRLDALGDVETTHDGTVRVRAPDGLVARSTTGETVDLGFLTRVLGEAAVAERAFLAGLRLEGPLRAVLLVENLGAWRDFPALPGWLFAYVPGWDTPTVVQFLDHVAHVQVVHFGDLDPNGVRIYQHLRERRPDLLWLVPEFWGEHIELRRQEGPWPPELDLSKCPSLVQALAERALWLEQESIVVDARLPQFLEALVGASSKRG